MADGDSDPGVATQPALCSARQSFRGESARQAPRDDLTEKGPQLQGRVLGGGDQAKTVPGWGPEVSSGTGS